MRSMIYVTAAFILLAVSSGTSEAADTPKAKAGCPCGECPCADGKPCTCGVYCSCPNCPEKSLAARFPGKTIHISPDGTVNELCADGIYRAIPGAPKAKPYPAPAAAGAPHVIPITPNVIPIVVGAPGCPSCPGGVCPAPSVRRGFFR